jgi:signal transduction histidine kinase
VARGIRTPAPVQLAPAPDDGEFARLASSFERLLLGFAELGPENQILRVNPRFAALIGLSPQACSGKPLSSFLADDDQESIQDHIRRFRPGFADAGVEVPIQAGETRAWLKLQFLAGEAGVRYIVATDMSRDVGENRVQLYERARLEERVNDRTVELESLVRELQAFNNLVTHDLRTPVRVVQGFSEFALTEAERLKSPMLKQYLLNIRDGTVRMNAIIEGLQRLSHMSRRELRRERIDLAEIAQRIGTDLRRRSPKRKFTLKVQEELQGFVDPAMAEILLQNLLENAWKFSSKKESTEIQVGRRRKGDRDYYFVQDNGAGFNPALADQLFQPFRRLHPADEFEGTGLGLATVHQIVRRHRGRIFAETKQDEGTTFYFTLSHWKDW